MTDTKCWNSFLTETKWHNLISDRNKVAELTPWQKKVQELAFYEKEVPQLDPWQKQSGRIHSLTEIKWQNSILDIHKVLNVLKRIGDAKFFAMYTRRWVPWSIQMKESAVECKCYRICIATCCGMYTWHRRMCVPWAVRCTREVFWNMQTMLAWNVNMRVGSQVRKSTHIPRWAPCNVRKTA